MNYNSVSAVLKELQEILLITSCFLHVKANLCFPQRSRAFVSSEENIHAWLKYLIAR